MTFVLRIAGISCRLGRRRYFSPFRRVIRQIINNAASWRPDLPQRHLSPTTLTQERVFPKFALNLGPPPQLRHDHLTKREGQLQGSANGPPNRLENLSSDAHGV